MNGMVLEIHRAALDDGPGVRTSVFLKGCPLHCPWCHNPESQAAVPELLLRRDLCTACGRCYHTCPDGLLACGARSLDRQRCISCGRCSAVCPSGALTMAGTSMSAEEVLHIVSLDIGHYRATGGGLTITGGEPLYQSSFTCELLLLAHEEGIHTCVETSGAAGMDDVDMLLPHTGLWLFDIKGPETLYEQVIGIPFFSVKANLCRLLEQQAAVILRCPIIPGFNDNDRWMEELCKLISEMNGIYPLQGVELLPFHRLGLDKYAALGKKAVMAEVFPPDDVWLDSWNEKIRCIMIK